MAFISYIIESQYLPETLPYSSTFLSYFQSPLSCISLGNAKYWEKVGQEMTTLFKKWRHWSRNDDVAHKKWQRRCQVHPSAYWQWHSHGHTEIGHLIEKNVYSNQVFTIHHSSYSFQNNYKRVDDFVGICHCGIIILDD